MFLLVLFLICSCTQVCYCYLLLFVCEQICMYVCVHVCVYLCIYVCLHECMWVCVSQCVCNGKQAAHADCLTASFAMTSWHFKVVIPGSLTLYVHKSKFICLANIQIWSQESFLMQLIYAFLP